MAGDDASGFGIDAIDIEEKDWVHGYGVELQGKMKTECGELNSKH
jgi:hypothetical protein